MRKILVPIILLIALSIVSCKDNKEKKRESQPTETKLVVENNFNWLLGNWKRNNNQEGEATYEIWHKKNDKTYEGIGFTMQDKDTIKQESIKLFEKDGKWLLDVKSPEDKEWITFKVTDSGKGEFTCENLELEFPNKIRYWENDSKLNALVSGKEMELAFEFEKIK